GDFGQELADVFDFSLGPHVNDPLADLGNLRSSHLAHGNVVGKRVIVYAKPLCRFARGKPSHSSFSVGDIFEFVKSFDGPIVRNEESKASGLRWTASALGRLS